MTAPQCSICDRPVADGAYLCAGCTDRLEHTLGDVPALAQELETTKLRQSRTGGQGVGYVSGSSTRPLPYEPHALEVADDLKAILVGWVRSVYDERAWCGHYSCMNLVVGPPCPSYHPLPDDNSPALAVFLLAAVGWIRHQQFAPEVLEDLVTVTVKARQAIDRHAEMAYAGPCRATVEAVEDKGDRCCVVDLYGHIGANVVRCKECGSEHDVKERQDWLLEVAEDLLVHAGLLSSAVSRLGHSVTSAMIRGYAHRGRLTAHGVDLNGRPLYRVGDLLDLLHGQGRRAG